MRCYKDRTYCASPECKNECGRKLSKEEEESTRGKNVYIAYSYFCGAPKSKNMEDISAEAW